MVYHRILNIILCAILQDLVGYSSYNTLHWIIPNSNPCFLHSLPPWQLKVCSVCYEYGFLNKVRATPNLKKLKSLFYISVTDIQNIYILNNLGTTSRQFYFPCVLKDTRLSNDHCTVLIRQVVIYSMCLSYLSVQSREGRTSLRLSAVLGTCMLNHSVMSDSLRPHGLQLVRLLSPWNSPSKSTGAGYHFLLQGIFPTQGLNPCLLCLLHCRQILNMLNLRIQQVIIHKCLLADWLTSWLEKYW